METANRTKQFFTQTLKEMARETPLREAHKTTAPYPRRGHGKRTSKRLFAMAYASWPSKSKSYFSTSISAEPPASKVMAPASCRV